MDREGDQRDLMALDEHTSEPSAPIQDAVHVEEDIVPEDLYEEIHGLLSAGEIVPFLGSGASLPDDLGDFDPKEPQRTPTGGELADVIADAGGFPGDQRELATVAQYYEIDRDRPLLNRRMRQLFARDFKPHSLHHYLAALEPEKPLFIMTTNYDRLIEAAFDAADKPFRVIIHSTEQEEVRTRRRGEPRFAAINPKRPLEFDLEAETVIYKMHGGIDPTEEMRDSFVVTEDDYIDYLNRLSAKSAIPTEILDVLKSRWFLFLGYSLSDWNLRVLVSQIAAETQQRKNGFKRSWSIQKYASEVETIYWDKKYNVQTFRLEIKSFLAGLEAAG